MAPERLKSHLGWQLKKSDVWTVGVMTYEMVTGKRCFYAENIQALAEKITNADFRYINRFVFYCFQLFFLFLCFCFLWTVPFCVFYLFLCVYTCFSVSVFFKSAYCCVLYCVIKLCLCVCVIAGEPSQLCKDFIEVLCFLFFVCLFVYFGVSVCCMCCVGVTRCT